MNHTEVFSLFNRMISSADQELFSFTKTQGFSQKAKTDKSLVTACDQHIDKLLGNIAQQAGFDVVSEEGSHVQEIVENGNYFTIDPIDGTLGYIEYVNAALENGKIEGFAHEDRGAASDFCLLLGIVQNAQPRFGAVYNYVTKEKILLAAEDSALSVRQKNVRKYDQRLAVYFDQRFVDDEINTRLRATPGVSSITQAAFGLKSVYTMINPHESAATVHRVQSAGLWDVLPAAVAAKAYGGQIVDDEGNDLVLDKYIVLPGKGATAVKGTEFGWVREEL